MKNLDMLAPLEKGNKEPSRRPAGAVRVEKCTGDDQSEVLLEREKVMHSSFDAMSDA